MKKILSFISVIVISCTTLCSCDKLDLDFVDIVSAVIGLIKNDDDDDDDDWDWGIYHIFDVVNNSDSDIYWYVPSKEYQDKMADEFNEEFCHLVKANNTSSYWIYDDNDPVWTYGPDDELPIYFITKSVMDTFEWKDIVEKQLWSAVKYYSAQDIVDLDQKIEYPF